jgi:hypothetical protein
MRGARDGGAPTEKRSRVFEDALLSERVRLRTPPQIVNVNLKI